jgi:hypothetical protein
MIIKEWQMENLEFRIVIGEKDNKVGRNMPIKAKTFRGALIARGKLYKGDGWSRIEYKTAKTDWIPW